jgi:gliding motility-associated-like protein
MKHIIFLLLVSSTYCFGQLPTISDVQPVSQYPNLKILVTGSGFSANSAQLQVWLGQVKGVITSSTEFSIEVTVPPQASLDVIEVINLSSRLSGKSKLKLVPNFSGEGFDPAKLETPPLSFAGDRVFDLTACDLDGDGKPDLIGTKDVNPFTDLIVLKNNSTIGSIAFTKFDKTNLASLNLLAPTGNVTCGDLNGDGKPDIVASRSGTTSNSIFILPNTSTVGSLSFGPFVTLNLENASDFARHIALHDLNADGKPEIIVANSFSNVLYIFQNQSAGGVLNINSTPVKVTVTGATGTLGLTVQDFNGDGKPDIALTQNQAGDIYVLKNQSSGTISFAQPAKIVLAGSFNDINSADFNRDGKPDLVVTSVFNTQTIVLVNQSTTGTLIFSVAATLTTDSGPFGVEVSDINGDGTADIIVPARGINAINVFLNNGNATPGFNRINIPTTKNNWFSEVGDLDGDAKPDIAFTSFNATGTQFSIDILRNKNCHLPKILNEGPLAICPGQTIRLTTVPIPGVTFVWNDGSTDTPSGSNPFLDITTAGNYKVTATGEGAACNVASSPLFTVTAGIGPVPSDPVITSNAPLCAGSTLNLGTGTVAGATYTWEGPNNFTSSLEDPTIPDVTALESGIYSLVVKVGDCRSNIATSRVDIVDLESFSISSNSASGIICQGQNAIFTVNSGPGYTQQWIKDGADIAGQIGTTLTTSQEGSYSARVTRSSAPMCSTETPAIGLLVYTAPVASFQVNPSACATEVLSFTNQSTVDNRATVSNVWDFDDGTANSPALSPTHAYTVAATYNPVLTVSYTSVPGCSDTDTKSIVVSDTVIPDILSDVPEICPGEPAVLSISGTFTSITWSTGETSSSINVTSPGAYSVTTTDAGNCEGMDDFTLPSKSSCGEIDIAIPVLFSPNGDSNNDTWNITGSENYPDCTMSVFDGRGMRVYEKKGYPNPGWDGTSANKEVPAGTYFYVFGCPSGQPKTGSVLIIR